MTYQNILASELSRYARFDILRPYTTSSYPLIYPPFPRSASCPAFRVRTYMSNLHSRRSATCGMVGPAPSVSPHPAAADTPVPSHARVGVWEGVGVVWRVSQGLAGGPAGRPPTVSWGTEGEGSKAGQRAAAGMGDGG